MIGANSLITLPITMSTGTTNPTRTIMEAHNHHDHQEPL